MFCGHFLTLPLNLLIRYKANLWNCVQRRWVQSRLIQDWFVCFPQTLKRGSPTASSFSLSVSETWSSSHGTLVGNTVQWTYFITNAVRNIDTNQFLMFVFFRPLMGAVSWRGDGASLRGCCRCCKACLYHQIQWHQCWCESFLQTVLIWFVH